jgi:PAS domain S-box-containing protein
MVQDITERKRVEQALRESDQGYKDFIAHSNEGVWRVDLEQPIPINLPEEEMLERILRYGYIAECNLALARTFGFSSPEELIGIRLRDLIPTSDQERLESFRSSVRGRLGSRTVELRGRDKAGNLKHLLRTEIPIVENGMLVNVWGITRDITELKRAEEDLQRSLEQLRALAGRLQSIREEERKRVARDIHDQLGQALTAIKIDLSSLAQELPAGEEPQSKRASSLLKLVEESIRTVRRISTELRPGMLDDLGLVATIEWAGEDFQARTGTTCRLDLPQDDIAVDPERATAIFRIFQETLTNVARHADASEVSVRLTKEDSDVTLEVHDNGKGISEDILASGKSLGILGMRERAMLLGGELTISGPPGNGTTVKVRIPEAPPQPAGTRP